MRFVKFRKKKRQYILLGIIFTIAVTLLCVCITLGAVANNFAKEYYKGDKTPDVTYFTASESCYNKTLKWVEGKSVRNLYKSDNLVQTSNNVTLNGKMMESFYSYFIPVNNIKELTWKVNVISGDKESLSPKKGEIWVPKIFADTKGVKLGDKIGIKLGDGSNVELKIKALITDSNNPTTAMGVNYFYINNEYRNSLTNVKKAYLVAFNKEAGGKESTEELIKYINEPLHGLMPNKDMLIGVSIVTPIMMGGVALISSVLLIVVLIIVLRANLWNNILKEYKSIGIYKSIGMSSKDIGGLYLNVYGAVSLIASFIGVLISIPISNYICNIVLEYMGKYSFDKASLLIITLIFIGFNLLVFINLKLVLRRINKIKPVEAINIGVRSSKEKFKKSLIKNNSSSLAMAINDIFKHKKSSIITLFMFFITFYISILFVNIQNSTIKIEDNSYNWFGNPKSDMVITASITSEDTLKEVMKYIEEKEYSEKIYLLDSYNSKRKATVNKNKYNVELQSFFIDAYNEYNEEDYSITKGRNPREKNEVSLSGRVMKDNKLALGDYMELMIEGERKQFLITGVYDSMLANRENLRILSKAIDGQGGNIAYIKLKNKKEFENIKKELEKKFDYITANKTYPMIKDAGVQIKKLMTAVISTILIGMLAFSAINVISTVISINADNRKNYGIMKAQGFSSGYIRNRCLYRIMLLSFSGGIIGLGVNLASSRYLFRIMISGIDGYLFTQLGTALIIASMLLVTFISTIFCCRSIKKVSIVELIVD